MSTTKVDAAPIAEYCLRRVSEGETSSQLAMRAGMVKRQGRHVSGDTSALKRTLGLMNESDRRGPGHTRQAIQYETAVRIGRASGLDPVDIGI